MHRRGTFIEYAKRLVDDMHAWYSRSSNFKITKYTQSIRAIHFYDSIVVMEKEKVSEPVVRKTGQMMLPEYHPETTLFFKLTSLRHKLSKK